MKTRIEIHLERPEVAELDRIAKQKGRSRKNLCEQVVREMIKTEIKQ